MSAPVVLLHALATTSAIWAEPRATLERAGHRVIASDQRGYGDVPLGDAPDSLDVAADDLARALDAEGVDEAVLAGCSMGGYVALAFLRRHPGRVRALALLNTHAAADDEAAAARRLGFAGMMLDPASREAVVAASIPPLLGATTRAERPGLLEGVRAIVESVPAEAIAWSQRAIAARADGHDVLRALDVPAVVVAGEEDELVPLDAARAAAAALPRGELVVVPGAGHLTPVEAPAAVARLLLGLADAADGVQAGAGPFAAGGAS